MINQDPLLKVPEPKIQNQKPTKAPWQGLIILAVLVVLIIWGFTAIFGGSGKKAKYQASLDISNAAVINPATLSVSFHVKNIGNAPGQPYCTINVSDPSGTYNGTDVLSDGPTIKPGQTVTSADQITITKQGAQYITTGTISCS